MDGKIAITTEQEGNGFYIAQFKTQELAVFTYYIESKGEVLLLDPTYDVKPYQQLIAKRNSTVKYTALTHYHADFLSGAVHFAAPLLMGPGAKSGINKFQINEQEDGSVVSLGEVTIKLIHTPGHTKESSSYLLIDRDSVPSVVFTGDTLFIGDVGRPDLAISPGAKVEDEAAILYNSIQKLKALDDSVRIYPAHGSGSACGKAIGASNFCSIEGQKQSNAFLKYDQEEFVKNLCTGISKPPKYFLYDSKLNQIGFAPYKEMLEKANNPLSVEQFTVLAEKLPVIDTRADPEVVIKGKNIFWFTAKGATAGWTANILPTPETEYIIFTEPGKWEETAERLLRIGYFNIKGYNNFSINEWKGEVWKPHIVNYDQLKQLGEVRYLDCRNKPEWETTGVLENAVLIPLGVLHERAVELKDHKNIVVHCRTGLRARAAASILMQHGIESTVLAETVTEFESKGGLKLHPYQE